MKTSYEADIVAAGRSLTRNLVLEGRRRRFFSAASLPIFAISADRFKISVYCAIF